MNVPLGMDKIGRLMLCMDDLERVTPPRQLRTVVISTATAVNHIIAQHMDSIAIHFWATFPGHKPRSRQAMDSIYLQLVDHSRLPRMVAWVSSIPLCFKVSTIGQMRIDVAGHRRTL